MTRSREKSRTPARPGLTLVEVVVSTAIVGTLLAASFTAAGVSAQRSLSTTEHSRAAWLAHDLLAEIAAKPCRANDPGNPGGGVTLDLGLIGVTIDADSGNDRAGFTNVFDFHGWNASPPVDPDGTPITGYTGWTRAATVEPVDPIDLSPRSGTDTTALVTVTTVGPGGQRAVIRTLRTAAADEARGTAP